MPGPFTAREADSIQERRLRRIEEELETFRQERDFTGAAAAPLSTVPDISGLTLEQGVGTVRVSWDAVPIGNLRFYRVQLSETTDFASPIERRTRETAQDFSVGSAKGTTTFYARVRAETTQGATGNYTSTVSSTPGQADTEDIVDLAIETAKIGTLQVTTLRLADNAATIPEAAFTAGSQAISANVETTIQTVDVTMDDASAPVHLTGTFDVIASGATNSVIRLYRDSTKLAELDSINLTSTNRRTPALAFGDTPGSTGTFTYDLTFEPEADATVRNASLVALGIKK